MKKCELFYQNILLLLFYSMWFGKKLFVKKKWIKKSVFIIWMWLIFKSCIRRICSAVATPLKTYIFIMIKFFFSKSDLFCHPSKNFNRPHFSLPPTRNFFSLILTLISYYVKLKVFFLWFISENPPGYKLMAQSWHFQNLTDIQVVHKTDSLSCSYAPENVYIYNDKIFFFQIWSVLPPVEKFL
jgi:hypothetical protein